MKHQKTTFRVTRYITTDGCLITRPDTPTLRLPNKIPTETEQEFFWFHSSLFLKKKNKNVRKLWPPAVSSMSQTTRYKSNNNNSTSIQASREEARPQFVFFAFTAVRSLSLCLLPFSVGGGGGLWRRRVRIRKKRLKKRVPSIFAFLFSSNTRLQQHLTVSKLKHNRSKCVRIELRVRANSRWSAQNLKKI